MDKDNAGWNWPCPPMLWCPHDFAHIHVKSSESYMTQRWWKINYTVCGGEASRAVRLSWCIPKVRFWGASKQRLCTRSWKVFSKVLGFLGFQEILPPAGASPCAVPIRHQSWWHCSVLGWVSISVNWSILLPDQLCLRPSYHDEKRTHPRVRFQVKCSTLDLA